jgi:protein-tyrosine phosphatase
MHREAALALENLGGDPSDFAARQLTQRIAADADLVLTMTTAHRDTLLELAPQKMQKTFTLSEASRLAAESDARTIADLAALRPRLAAHERPDIADPIGQSAEVFADVGSQIANFLGPVLDLCRRSTVAAAD